MSALPSSILLTGATGVVGLAVVQRLLEDGHQLKALVRDAKKAARLLPQEVTILEGSLADLILMREAMEGCTICIHMAGLVQFGDSHKEQLLATNHGLTATLVNRCLAAEGFKHLIHFGSVAAIPLADGDKQTIPRPNQYSSFYGYTKRLSELEVHRGGAEGLGFTILQPSVVLSPHPDQRSSSGAMRVAALPTTFCPPGDMHWVAGKDVAEAVAKAVQQGPEGKTYVLDGQTTSWRYFFNLFRSSLGLAGKVYVVPAWSFSFLSLVAPIASRLLGITIPSRKQLLNMLRRHQYAGLADSEALLGRPFLSLEETITTLQLTSFS